MKGMTDKTVVQGSRQVLEVEPDVERRRWGHVHLQSEPGQTLKNVVTLVLEVLLQRDFLLVNMVRLQQRDRRELQTNSCRNDLVSGTARKAGMRMELLTDGWHRRQGRNRIVRER